MVVKVYLDNQDFSRLYRPPNERLAEIASELLALADGGVAAFYYSYWHVFEFLQPAEQAYLQDRRDRAAFLSRICRSNALPYFTDILKAQPPREGIWVPTEVVLTVTSRLRERLDETITAKTKGMSRAFRRKAHSHSVQRRAFGASFPGNAWEKKTQLQEGFTDEFVSSAPISRLFRGEITDEQFRHYLAQMFCQPEYFFEQWFVKGGRENPIKQQINEIGDKWILRLEDMRDNIEKYEIARSIAAKNRRIFYDQLRDSDLPNAAKKDLSDRLPELPPRIDVAAMLAEISQDARLAYVACYLRHHITTSIKKKNDIADLMHLFYIEDVDLIRCDRAIYNVMRGCPYLDQSKIVASLDALPARIRALATTA